MSQRRRYAQYRDSGVEWLGEIPSRWSIRKTKYLVQIRKRIAGELGHDVLSITQSGIRVKDIESGEGQVSMDYSKYQLVEPGDFAMNHMDLLTGWVDISPCSGVTSPDYRVFSVEDVEANPKYFLYLFQMGYFNRIFYAYGQGSSHLGRWRFPTNRFENFFLPYPDPEEQLWIANYLDRETTRIDALVLKKQRLLELLREKRQGVITQAVTKGLDPAVPMKDSGIEWLGEVPEHWAKVALGYRYEVVLGKMLDQKRVTGEFLSPYLRNVDVQWDQINVSDLPEMDFSGPDVHKYALRIGDLLVCEGGDVGRCAIWNGEAERVYYQKALHRLRPYEPRKDNPRFLMYVLWNASAQGRFVSSGGKATIAHLTAESLRRYVFAYPEKEEQDIIVAYVDELRGRYEAIIARTETSISLLREHRSALITAAVTGQIDVRDAA